MTLWMAYTVYIILVDAAVTIPIKITGAAIVHFSVNTFEESFPIRVWRRKERGRLHGALHGAK